MALNPQDFNRILNKRYPDLRLMMNPVDGLYWVVQVRVHYSPILLPDNRTAEDFYKLFPIKNIDGSFRMPERRDLEQADAMVKSALKFQEKGADWWVDNMERNDFARFQQKQDKLLKDIELSTKDNWSVMRRAKTTHMGQR